MATIKISDLQPIGYQFFFDSESYLNELTDEELKLTHGGSTPFCIAGVVIGSIAASAGIAAWGYQIGRDMRRRQEYRNGNACYP
ncbi:MAG: class IIb bacteriocin, lactobin A/cerein 7B family [Nostoc sp. S4]|nr:class IIb bacteriocin, lactobin A/cerein 7B family [Nostoc sp. S4]